MSRLTVCKTFEFDSAHFLPNYEGKCKNLHGHRFKLEIEVSGDVQEGGPCEGMIVDFGDLKSIVEDCIIKPFDHKLLNEVYEGIPTAENLVRFFAKRLAMNLPMRLALIRVRLYETPTSFAELIY